MRLGWTTSKYSTTYRAVKTTRIDGKNVTVTVKSFGSEKFIKETYGVEDAKKWAQEQVNLMNQEEAEDDDVLIRLSPKKDRPMHEQKRYNAGYLYLQQIYYELGLDRICKAISKKHAFEFNLNSILSRLIYTRILYPSSKLGSLEDSKRFIEPPDFELQHIYRSLSVLAEESDYIQTKLFKSSLKLVKRKTGIIYYDCTNFYFEINAAEDDKQYGYSKEHRPNPIVQMGLFMDAEGIPLAFSINPGNQNEQLSLKPLEQKLIDNFGMSKFVVCTDAGLSSYDNRKFNDYDDEAGNNRAFVTTQSIKTLKKDLKAWALTPEGWSLKGSKELFNINEIDEEKHKESIFYKKRMIRIQKEPKSKETLDQQLIITYSIEYRDYARKVREGQKARAEKLIEQGIKKIETKGQNDPRRFIKGTHTTKDGTQAQKVKYEINQSVIDEEAKYDGFYGIGTNLSDNVETILEITKRRWEIEECFRIMKSEFAARPVYVRRQDRIVAHFITCFIALIIYRFLEKRLDEKFTCSKIIDELKELDYLKREGWGYEPIFERTELTNALDSVFGSETSKEFLSLKKVRNFCAKTKKGVV